MKEAARVIQSAREYFRGFSEVALSLVKDRNFQVPDAVKVSDQLFPAVDGKVTPGTEHARESVVGLFKEQAHNHDHNIAGTRWGYLQAVSAYVDHNIRRRDAETRLESLLFGTGVQVKARAAELVAAA